MSYDLAFWEGARPTTDDEALRLFEELFNELDRRRRVEPWGQVTFAVCDLDDNLISFGSPMP